MKEPAQQFGRSTLHSADFHGLPPLLAQHCVEKCLGPVMKALHLRVFAVDNALNRQSILHHDSVFFSTHEAVLRFYLLFFSGPLGLILQALTCVVGLAFGRLICP
jgi:hypothetical protein